MGNKTIKGKNTFAYHECILSFFITSKNGFIKSYYGDETQGKRRTYYQITDLGISYYKEKCEEWRLTKEVINHFIKEDL